MKARYPLTQEAARSYLPNANAFDLKVFVTDHEVALDELDNLLADLAHEQSQRILREEGISD